ncbi:MAG: ATP phosphoribosyltransferase, partial [Pelagibacterales bacterium]|nr:ATP phosphoribosyltransferase [Pelagibacterales bacterium]
DFITDLSSSGETLRQNILKVIDDGVILKSSACLFAAKNSMKKKEVKKIIKLFT